MASIGDFCCNLEMKKSEQGIGGLYNGEKHVAIAIRSASQVYIDLISKTYILRTHF